jgi:hypothetical protein
MVDTEVSTLVLVVSNLVAAPSASAGIAGAVRHANALAEQTAMWTELYCAPAGYFAHALRSAPDPLLSCAGASGAEVAVAPFMIDSDCVRTIVLASNACGEEPFTTTEIEPKLQPLGLAHTAPLSVLGVEPFPQGVASAAEPLGTGLGDLRVPLNSAPKPVPGVC